MISYTLIIICLIIVVPLYQNTELQNRSFVLFDRKIDIRYMTLSTILKAYYGKTDSTTKRNYNKHLKHEQKKAFIDCLIQKQCYHATYTESVLKPLKKPLIHLALK